MSKRSTRPTSSIPTLGSWDDTVKLGEHILDQLGRDHRSEDLLVHWVAHALAEKMLTAQNADDAAERAAARDAATLLIARLWEARGGWPGGWPSRSVRRFADRRASSSRLFEEGANERLPPWLSSYDRLEALHEEERRVWLYAALLEQDARELQVAVDALPPDAQGDDVDALRTHVRRHDEAVEWFAERASATEVLDKRADRAVVLGRVLEDLSARRAELIEMALRDARRNQWRKSEGVASRSVGDRQRQRRRRRAPSR